MRRYQYLTENIFLIKKKPITWSLLDVAEHKNAFYNCIQSQGHEGDCKDGEILGQDWHIVEAGLSQLSFVPCKSVVRQIGHGNVGHFREILRASNLCCVIHKYSFKQKERYLGEWV